MSFRIKIAELDIKILFISTGTHFDLNSTKSHNIPLFKERKFQTRFPLHFPSLITIATAFYSRQCMCKTSIKTKAPYKNVVNKGGTIKAPVFGTLNSAISNFQT